MKKLLILSIAIFTLFSCSDNDEENIEKDPFIGIWGVFSIQGEEVNECKKNSTLMNTESGNFSTTDYNDDNGDCIKESEAIGTWENAGNNVYITKEGGKEQSINVTFENNNNTAVFTGTETHNGTSETFTIRLKRK